MSEKEQFGDMLGDDVIPMGQEKRISLTKEKDRGVDKSQRRLSALESRQVPKEDPLSSTPTKFVDPLDVLSYKRPGVQHGVFRNLRLGKYQLDARLDLHRMTVEEARKAVFIFIQDCHQNDVRAALITHGKGEGREMPAMLKSCVAYWLPEMDAVLAFHTAQKQHGSYGATYVLIKKSEKKKQESREQNKRGS